MTAAVLDIMIADIFTTSFGVKRNVGLHFKFDGFLAVRIGYPRHIQDNVRGSAVPDGNFQGLIFSQVFIPRFLPGRIRFGLGYRISVSS